MEPAIAQPRGQQRRPPAVNYLDNPTIALFFEVREHAAHYLGLHGISSKRDCHETLVDRCDAFVLAALVPENERLLDNVIRATKRPAPSLAATPATDTLWAQAHAGHPTGLALLGLQPPLTRDRLKQGYRQSALKYHPDAGGSHEEMVLINEAFDLFSSLLDAHEARQAASPAAPGVCPRVIKERNMDFLKANLFWRIATNSERSRCCHDFRCGIGLLLLAVAIDDWRLDDAYGWLCKFKQAAWSPRESDETHAQRISLGVPATRLAERLAAANKTAQAWDAFEIGKTSGTRLHERAREVITGTRKLAVRLNHRRQVEFAYQSGVIGRRECYERLERLDAARKRDTESASEPCLNADVNVPPLDRYPSGEGLGWHESRYIWSEDNMDSRQRAFYESWKQHWNEGTALDVQGMLSYLLCFTQTVLALGPTTAIPHLQRLIGSYTHERRFADQCRRWRSDCYVVLHQYRQALDAYPPISLGTRSCSGTDALLSLKLATGVHLAGRDILTIDRPRLNRWGKAHLVEIAAALDLCLEAYERRNMINLLDASKATSRQHGYLVFRDTTLARETDLPCFSFSRNVDFLRPIGEMTRDAENAARKQMDIPRVGEARPSDLVANARQNPSGPDSIPSTA